MKYKTFTLLRKIAVIVIVIVILLILFPFLCNKPSKHRTISLNNNYPTSSVASTQPSYGSPTLAISKIDKEIFEYQKSDIKTGNIDDQGDSYKKFITTSSYKLDLRCDFKKGYSYWNRIKIDYDKDGNWDEKWSYQKNGKIKKEVSSDDNEKYNYTYFLKADEWEKK
jgi:hypothetical protein